jgi:hypothetical protein
MIDSAQRPGWWQASDGNWYPPEAHPDPSRRPGWWQASDGNWYPPESQPGPALQMPPRPTPPAQSYTQFLQPTAPKKQSKPWWRRWWAITLGAFIVLIVIAAIASPPDDSAVQSESRADSNDSADVEDGASPVDEQAGPVGSRDQPVPIGQPTTITMDTFGDADGSVWTLTVTGTGSDYTQAVAAENQFNEPPEAGKTFYAVPVSLTLESADKEPLSVFINLQFEFFGPSTLSIVSDGFSEGCGVTPGELDPFKEVFVGGTISGVVCYAVANEDAAAGVLLTVDSIEGDRLFVATN